MTHLTAATPVIERLRGLAEDRKWTYLGPQRPALMEDCRMRCAHGHEFKNVAAAFLFPPTAGCPVCLAGKKPKKPPNGQNAEKGATTKPEGKAKTNRKPREEKPVKARVPKPPRFRPYVPARTSTTYILTQGELEIRFEAVGVMLVGPWKGTSNINTFECPTCGAAWAEKGMMQTNRHLGCPHCHPRNIHKRTTPVTYTLPETKTPA